MSGLRGFREREESEQDGELVRAVHEVEPRQSIEGDMIYERAEYAEEYPSQDMEFLGESELLELLRSDEHQSLLDRVLEWLKRM